MPTCRKTPIIHETAKINWLENGDPYSEQFQDIYFSSIGGLIETESVFLKYNGFPQRFLINNNKPDQSHTRIKIGETGFGTGLNFLTSIWYWLQITDFKRDIEYITVEKYPLNKSQLKQIYASFRQKWPKLSPICTELLKQYPDNFSQQENRKFEFHLFNQPIKLTLLLDDASSGLQQILSEHKNTIDAWYLDGFAPAKNPDMWQQKLFQIIAKLSKTGTTLSTFTAAGFVRRGLTEAGFNMSKAPGIGKKREHLYGVKS